MPTRFYDATLQGLLLPIVMMLGAAPACHEAAAPAAPAVAKAAARHALAITHVTLIDPTSGARPNMTIVIDGARIADVGPSNELAIPEGATVLEGSNRFAVPGFLDAHVHVSQIGVDAIRLLVANGVTSVRDMGSAFAEITRWRELRSSGGLAPRVFSPGPKIDGRGEEWDDSWVLSSPDDVRHGVARLKAIGVDFIKVHSGLSRAQYDALADESRKQGLSFAGHLGKEYPALTAVARGQRTIEHGNDMVPCDQRVRERIRADPAHARFAFVCAPESDAEAILPAMARAGVWFTPTLVSWRGHTLKREAVARLDGVHYVPAVLERRWAEPEPPLDAMELELHAALGPLAAKAHRADVHLLVGSDVGDPYVVPGFALHDEMQLFVEAGIPPLVAIRSATLEPARALGVAHALGSIERGKAADVVLLGADPLADIRNTRRITAVVMNGRLLTATYLAALLDPLRH
ncbi:amidohydrolase family protein [Pendulispora albinea]|uniref:Amidohydrolase family protein n=1 Tax=Pendulispora albinea TaxID=2741071 RepID=A0ABZ2LZJ8_9BACT